MGTEKKSLLGYLPQLTNKYTNTHMDVYVLIYGVMYVTNLILLKAKSVI